MRRVRFALIRRSDRCFENTDGHRLVQPIQQERPGSVKNPDSERRRGRGQGGAPKKERQNPWTQTPARCQEDPEFGEKFTQQSP